MIKNYYFLYFFFLFGIYFLNINLASAVNNTEKTMSAKINQNCDFSKLNLDVASGQTECSPVVTEKQIMEGLTGIFINMPEKIPLKDSKVLKVCLLSIMEGEDAKKHGGSELLVLKSDVTNKVVNGRFVNDDREEPLPAQEENDDEESLDMIEEGYFNFNLNTYIDFDRKPGVYHFYITMGPFSSNVVTFEIVADK